MNCLIEADEALREGRLDVAQRVSQDCLRLATSRGAIDLEAGARIQLARCLSAQGDMTGALAHCGHALAIFESAHDPQAEIRTLAIAAYAATNLRERDQALGFAARAVGLGSALADTSLSAMAHNYMGVAQFWDGDAPSAGESFRLSIQLARRTGLPNAEVVPLQNHAAGEIATSLISRVLTDSACDPTRLTAIVAELSEVDLRKASVFASVRQRTENDVVMACLNSIGESWGGNLFAGREFIQLAAAAVASSRPNQMWVIPYVHLARHELAHVGRDFDGAIRHCLALEDSALKVQNYQMAWLGKALRLRALESSGKGQTASRGWRELLRDEMLTRNRRGATAHRTQPAASAKSAALDTPDAPRAARGSSAIGRQRVISAWRLQYGLTGSEAVVVDLLGGGLQVAAIAEKRGTSIGTVRNQLSMVYDKTGHRSQQALLAALLQSVDGAA